MLIFVPGEFVMNFRSMSAARATGVLMVGLWLAGAIVASSVALADDDWLPPGPGVQKKGAEHPSERTSGDSPLRLPGKQLLAGKPVRRDDQASKKPSAISLMFNSMTSGTKRFFAKTFDVLASPFSRKKASHEQSSHVVSRYPRHAASSAFPVASAKHERGGRSPKWPFGSLFKSDDQASTAKSPNEWITRPRP